MKRIPVYRLGAELPRDWIEVEDDANAERVVYEKNGHEHRAVVLEKGESSKPLLDRDDRGRFKRGLPGAGTGVTYRFRSVVKLLQSIASDVNNMARRARSRGPRDITGPFQIAEQASILDVFRWVR